MPLSGVPSLDLCGETRRLLRPAQPRHRDSPSRSPVAATVAGHALAGRVPLRTGLLAVLVRGVRALSLHLGHLPRHWRAPPGAAQHMAVDRAFAASCPTRCSSRWPRSSSGLSASSSSQWSLYTAVLLTENAMPQTLDRARDLGRRRLCLGADRRGADHAASR